MTAAVSAPVAEARSTGDRPRVLSHSLTMTRRNLRQLARSPELLVFLVIQPIMFVLLFVYVFGGSIDVPTAQYVDFLLPGIVVQTVAFATFSTGLGLAEDLTEGIIDRFRALPIARSAVLTGRILGDTVRIALSVVVITLVGVLVGFRFGGGILAAVGAFALAIAFGVAFSWVAAFIGLLVRTPEATNSAGFLWLFPLTFASSAFVDPANMPGWLRGFAEVNPISLTADAMRALLLGGPAAGLVWQSLAWIAGIAAVFSALAVRQYRRIS